ncbi:MAG: hypothetical protein E6K49_06885 [Gammaproteobacteria bacterium]|nr:MAG: hypothetical protein E6K49_06885 [Gammaproteobacteria bacterium]
MKERLTGAIVLVALIVLLVPALLTGPIRSAPAPQGAAPVAGEPPLRSYTIDLADDSHTRTTSAATDGSPAPRVSGPAQPLPIPPPANKTLDFPPSVGPSSTREAPAAGAAHTADAVQPPASDKPAVPDNPAVPDKPSAQPPAVTPPQETEHHPSSAQQPTNTTLGFLGTPADGWMVQLGSFARRANADRLARELKRKGFRAAVSESSGGGRRLYRVRVGPTADRSGAEQLTAKLRAAGHPGSIVSK